MIKNQLQQAIDYSSYGWSIIPIPYRKKEAKVSWKPYQNEKPSSDKIKKWFNNGPLNIAVILGAVSGGLCCRDFDDLSTYEYWARNHPDLAQTLPTVETARGRHVYFCLDGDGEYKISRHFSDGELRGNGLYCLLPPSIHPTGHIYRWAVPLKIENLLILTLEKTGFNHDGTENTETTEQTQKTEKTEVIVNCPKKIFGDIFIDRDKINSIIIETLPTEPGQRNKKVFELTRHLKTISPQADPRTCKDIVYRWFKQALPYIRTKEFAETWIDFLRGWEKVKYLKGEEPIMQMYQQALDLEPPAIAEKLFPTHQKLKTLVALCRELQKAAGENPFFISARIAGNLLGVSRMQANRWLFLLVSEEVLELVEKGGTEENPRKASRYIYQGGN